MAAVHIQTHGMHCQGCPALIENVVESLPGVQAARTYPSMALTSVLYDPEMVDPKSIETAIAGAGFTAHVVAGGTTH